MRKLICLILFMGIKISFAQKIADVFYGIQPLQTTEDSINVNLTVVLSDSTFCSQIFIKLEEFSGQINFRNDTIVVRQDTLFTNIGLDAIQKADTISISPIKVPKDIFYRVFVAIKKPDFWSESFIMEF